MIDKASSDRERKDKPSYSVFDPMAGMRVVADIQAEGLRAASALLERMLGAEQDHNGHRATPPSADYAALVDAWTELIRRFITGFADPGQLGVVTLQAAGDGPRQPVRVAQGSDAEVSLHNGTSSVVGPLVLSCGDMRDAKGKRLKGAKVRLKPRTLDSLEAGSTHPVKVSLRVKDEPRRGTYRGTIQAEGAPGLWLPVEVTV